MNLITVVAKRIRYFLNLKGWSIYKLSRETGISPNGIQIILNEENKDIKLTTLVLISNAFDMTVSQFLDLEEMEYKNLNIE